MSTAFFIGCFFCLGGVGAAGIQAFLAGLGALLAVVHGVLSALVMALLAQFDALFNNVLGDRRACPSVTEVGS